MKVAPSTDISRRQRARLQACPFCRGSKPAAGPKSLSLRYFGPSPLLRRAKQSPAPDAITPVQAAFPQAQRSLSVDGLSLRSDICRLPCTLALLLTAALCATAPASALANAPAITRFAASPTTLSAAGGRVRLQARVSAASVCRFSAANPQPGLPARRPCSYGHASVTVTIAPQPPCHRPLITVFLPTRRPPPAQCHR